MASYNKVTFIGNLTRDVELQYLPSGAAVAKFGLAMNRKYNDKNSGEQKEEVCFVDIVAWQRTAEICNEYLAKGKQVFIEGRLVLNSWETDDGQKRHKHEVVAERVVLIDYSDQEQQEDGKHHPISEGPDLSAPVATETAAPDDDIPF